MKRALLVVSFVLLLLAGEARAVTPSASAVLAACESSLLQADRHMVVEGRMRRIAGARRLLIRFELQIRDADRPGWTRVAAPGFGVWNQSRDPAPKRYAFAKRVEGLTAPASYRMVVRFRWQGRGGSRLASARRVSKSCRQADLRPDLTPTRVTVAEEEGTPDRRRYVIPVVNDGSTRAAPFAVVLTVNGRAVPAQLVPGLEAGGRAEVEIEAPRCDAGSSIAVRVDSESVVDERDEADNDLSRACPEPG